METTRTRLGWGLLATGAVLLALTASRYYTLDPDVYFQREVYQARTLALLTHITGMMLALLAGPLQLHRRLRERRLRWHRVGGRVYVAGAGVGGLAGLYLAQFTASGAVSDAGFAVLAIGLLLTTTVAVVRVVSGDVQGHREWMTRSYALVFAAVMLRLYLAPLQVVLGEHRGYAVVAWACWVPNLLVAEWLVRTRPRPRREPTPGSVEGRPRLGTASGRR